MYQVNVALDIFSIVISLLIVLHLVTSEDRKNRLNRLFLAMLLLNIGVLFCDMSVYLLMGTPGAAARAYLQVCNFWIYNLGYIIVAVFTDYLVTYVCERTRASRRLVHVMTFLCAVAGGLVILSQFNHMYYYYDAGNIYRRGSWYWLSQAYPIGMMGVDTLLILRNRKSMERREVISLLTYQVFPVLAMTIQIFIYGVTLLYIGTTLALLIIYVSIQMEHAQRLREQELRIMLSQIQPHFLYNSLTAIIQLCDIDPQEAKRALFQFSHYLRGNTATLTTRSCIPFETELEHVRSYVALEHIRFQDALLVVYDIQFTDFELPPLTLQPLVENAVRHGITKKRGGGTVTIRAERGAMGVRITVSDDGVGFDPQRAIHDGRRHLGIENVRSRLELMCSGTLEVRSAPDAGTVAVITLPEES